MTVAEDDFEAAFETALARIVATVLAALGPMTIERLCAALAGIGALHPLTSRGYDDEEQQGFLEGLLSFDSLRFFETTDGLFAHVATLLDGMVLTHRVTGDELRRNMLDLAPDLCLLERCRRLEFGVTGGGTAAIRYPFPESLDNLGLPRDPDADEHGSLVFAGDWLDGLLAGDVVAVRNADGALTVHRVNAPLSGTAVLPVLEVAYERQRCAAEADIADVLLEALAHHPTLFRSPVPPLTDLLQELGLDRDGGSIGRFPSRS